MVIDLSQRRADSSSGWRVSGFGSNMPYGWLHDPAGRGGRPLLADGSFVAYDRHVYRIAGGAPTYVSNWKVFGKPEQVRTLTAAQRAALRSSPADGTLVADSATGRVDEFAGGAPWYVDTWAGIDRVAQPATVVDDWNFAHMTDPLAHLRPVASDGTFVSGARTGRVYRVVAGIPFYVASWAPYRGPQLTTSIDQATIDHALLATLRRPIGPPPPGATGDPLRFRRP